MSHDQEQALGVFQYRDHFFLRVSEAHDHRRPLQVELHPGLHCDLYRCPHCYGHGQPPMPGRVLSVPEIAGMLDQVGDVNPLIVVSGITTEPLTHPDAAGILREIRSRDLRLGLFTKGYRFDAACADAVLRQGTSECFVTFSVDAVERDDYNRLHGIPVRHVAPHGSARHGEDYFDVVLANVRAFYEAKQRMGAAASHVQIRIALLLFEENSSDAAVDQAVATFTDTADIVRFAFPQTPNDGVALANVPDAREQRLHQLAERFKGHRKVRVLTNTAEPDRSRDFKHCHTQKFQVTIDKSGNVFPCPQVAVSNYAHLSVGNVRTASLSEILDSPQRRRLFDCRIDEDMKCRICDRKDEAVNAALEKLRLGLRP
ncbi:MAG: radical SAM protein [Proteobacteria bacterium]|nr:radical SAM protein [Pseudomonadota bacterium]